MSILHQGNEIHAVQGLEEAAAGGGVAARAKALETRGPSSVLALPAAHWPSDPE